MAQSGCLANVSWVNEYYKNDILEESWKRKTWAIAAPGPQRNFCYWDGKMCLWTQLCLKAFLVSTEINKFVESCIISGWEVKEEGEDDSCPWAGKVYNTLQTMGRNHPSPMEIRETKGAWVDTSFPLLLASSNCIHQGWVLWDLFAGSPPFLG